MVSCIPRISTSLYTIFTIFSFEGLTFKNKRKDLTIILSYEDDSIEPYQAKQT